LGDRNGIYCVKTCVTKSSIPEQVGEETEGNRQTQVTWKTAVETELLVVVMMVCTMITVRDDNLPGKAVKSGI